MGMIKQAVLATALGATALVAATPSAEARPYYRGGYYHHHYHGGDVAGAAIGAGILGLAVGAIAASSANNHNYDRPYVRPYYDGGWYFRDGYYWDRDGRRYTPYEYQRYQRGYYDRSGYYDRGYYDRGYDYRSGYDRDPGYERSGY